MLSSGKESEHYMNCKPVTLSCEGNALCSHLMIEHVEDNSVAVGGLTLGADPLVCGIAQKAYYSGKHIDALIVRKNPKEYGTKEVMKNMEDVDLKVRMKAKGAGRLRVKQMPNGVNANDIRVFLREYEIACGEKVDCLLVDYLDLMMPISAKVSGSDLFIKDKYVSEELRNLAVERDILHATASQLGRSAVEEVEYDHSHIAGGISKVNTADNVIGIFTSNAMRERGRYQIQFMKTRSSAGVGSKVDLKFDTDTLRIEDLEEGDEDSLTMSTNSLVDQLKRNSSIKAEDSENKDTVGQAMNMREFLSKNDDF